MDDKLDALLRSVLGDDSDALPDDPELKAIFSSLGQEKAEPSRLAIEHHQSGRSIWPTHTPPPDRRTL